MASGRLAATDCPSGWRRHLPRWADEDSQRALCCDSSTCQCDAHVRGCIPRPGDRHVACGRARAITHSEGESRPTERGSSSAASSSTLRAASSAGESPSYMNTQMLVGGVSCPQSRSKDLHRRSPGSTEWVYSPGTTTSNPHCSMRTERGASWTTYRWKPESASLPRCRLPEEQQASAEASPGSTAKP